MQIKPELFVYRGADINGEPIAYSDKMIVNGILRYIPLCLISWNVYSSPPAYNQNFGFYHYYTYNILARHNIGTSNQAPSPTDTDLIQPLFSQPVNADAFIYNVDTNANPRRAVIKSLKTFTFNESVNISEHGIYTINSYDGSLIGLTDRSVFSSPISVNAGDSITFVYTLTITV